MNLIRFAGVTLLATIATVANASGVLPPEVVAEFDQAVRLGDGTRLSADVYRPRAAGKHPVIVRRTPYDNRLDFDGEYFARNGYAYVVVDVRGRHDSAGEFYPYRDDARDGYEVIEWAAEQAWSNGVVGTIGDSYPGFNQWLAASEAPPSLKAMVVRVAPADYYDSPTYTGGAFNLGGRLPWSVLTSSRTLQNLYLHDWQRALKHLPLIDGDKIVGRELKAYRDWLMHPTKDDYWSCYSMRGRWPRVKVPVYHQGGWYDEFVRGTIDAYMAMRRGAGDADARQHQRLLIGPWTHALSVDQKVGDVDFGADSRVDTRREALEWFDWHLRARAPASAPPRVRVFVMGSNRWLQLQDWPPPDARQQEWFLTSEGAANTRLGNGKLVATAPANAGTDRYTYDPADPVPTTGGATCCIYPAAYPEIMRWGPYDQRDVELRKDVLTYTSEPMERDVTVVGPVTVVLHAATSARDTDFTAKLVDVHPDGYARHLTDGILRARFRESTTQPTLLQPGKIYELRIDLAATANTFRAGHRIRLEVSSSNFPWYDRNLNTGGHPALESRFIPAQQTIHHGAAHRSRLIVNVQPPEERS
jgi:uncharacterized protein